MSKKLRGGLTRINARFRELKASRQPAFMPFLMAGDPSIRESERLIHALVEAGADLIELGVPFSDPIADGPTIQRAAQRALRHGTTLQDVLQLVERVRQTTDVPIVLLVYYNLLCAMGLETFARAAVDHGVDGVVVPDAPPEEGTLLVRAARSAGLATIFLAAPTSSPDRVAQINRLTSGFVYYVSVTGITGARSTLPATLASEIQALRRRVKWPVCVGFGVSTPQQAKQLAAVADGVIVGSAIVQRVENAPTGARVTAVARFAGQLAAAVHSARRAGRRG